MYFIVWIDFHIGILSYKKYHVNVRTVSIQYQSSTNLISEILLDTMSRSSIKLLYLYMLARNTLLLRLQKDQQDFLAVPIYF